MTIGSIFGGVFRFIRANPPSIAIWGAIYFAVNILMRLGMAPYYQARAEAAARGLPPQLHGFGGVMLVLLAAMLVLLVLYAAVFRAVLFPEQRTAAYLRVGGDELRLLGLVLILFLAAVAIEIVVIIVGALIGLIVGLASGVGSPGAVIVSLALIVAILLAAIFATIRLAPCGPLTVLRRKIIIGDAWRLTRGHFWTLFGTYLVAAIALILISLPIVLPTMAPILTAMAHPGDPMAAAQINALQARQMALTAANIPMLLVSGILGAIILPIFGGLPAVATVQMLEERDARI